MIYYFKILQLIYTSGSIKRSYIIMVNIFLEFFEKISVENINIAIDYRLPINIYLNFKLILIAGNNENFSFAMCTL